MIAVESMALDMPVALGCDPATFDDAKTLISMDYFATGSCFFPVSESTENSIPMMGDDKICYYSNVQQLFTS